MDPAEIPEETHGMDLAEIPEEIWITIFEYCAVTDILAIGCTCRYLKTTVDTEYLWKRKWRQLVRSSPFRFPDIRKLQEQNLCFKRMCYRMHLILNLGDDVSFPTCYHCGGFTCRQNCLEDRGSRVVLDIGNKFSWIVTPSFGVRRHFSMFGFPKDGCSVPVPYSKCHTVSPPNSSTSQPSKNLQRKSNGPFCVFCNSVKLYREKKRLEREPWEESVESQRKSQDYAELYNGLCLDTVEVLGIPNMNVLSPAIALTIDTKFHVIRDYVDHIFHQMGLSPVLQKPNGILIFCEPLTMSQVARLKLLDHLFLRVKISRLCLVSKPLATAAMVGLDTCIVVDSGAVSTSVAVIINGEVDLGRWREIPVGGWHVAENLKQAMQWQPEEYAEIPISYLDSPAVKERCRISYNIHNEERRRGPARRELIHLRVDSYADYKQFWRVSLGEELYLAPEMMYTSLGLPRHIKALTAGLPDALKRDCLSRIIFTGGNSDLSGFRPRVHRDLCDELPEFRDIISLKSTPGSSSWSVAMGSTYLSYHKHGSTSKQYSPGSPFWLRREQYILHGFECVSLPERSST